MFHRLCSDRRERRIIAGLALVFSTLHLLSGVKENRYYAASPVLSCIVLFFLYYLLLSLLFRWVDRQNENVPVSRSARKAFWISFLFLSVCWLPYYLLSFPGNIAYDSATAILTYLEIAENFNIPPFLILLYGMVYRLGTLLGGFHISVAVFCTIQMLLYLCVYSYAMVLVSQSRAPVWLQCTMLLLYGLIPMFPMFALCIGKGSSFALPLAVFCLGIYEQLHNDSFYSSKFRTGIFFCSCVLAPLMRNGATLVIAVPLAILLIVSCFTPRRKTSQRAFLFCALAASVLIGIFLPRLIVPRSPDIAESLSIPLQQTAYCLRNHPLTEQEQEIINKVIPIDAFQEYNSRISDPIKQHFLNDASKKDILNYLMLWLRQFFKHPVSYCKAFYLHTDAYYTPGVLHSDIKAHIPCGLSCPDAFRRLVNWPGRNPGLRLISRFDRLLSDTFGLRLLQSIGFYTWMMLFTIAYRMNKGPRKHACRDLLPLVPAILILIGCCFSPVNGYIRYAYPAIICIPIFCTLTLFPHERASLDERP